MDKIAVNRVTNANVYMDGNSFMGKAEEVDLPMVKHIMSEHKALGIIGKPEFWAGLDKMEAKIKWNSIYPEVAGRIADPFTSVQLQVRASVETYGSQGRTLQVPMVCHMTGTFSEVPLGNYKQHDNVELQSSLSVTYIKQVIDGEEVLEIDVMANIYKVNGVDLLADYKANIGG